MADDTKRREELIQQLFGFAGRNAFSAVLDAYMKGLERMDTSTLQRIVDRLVAEFERMDDPSKFKVPTVGDLWALRRKLRANAPTTSDGSMQGSDAWRHDNFIPAREGVKRSKDDWDLDINTHGNIARLRLLAAYVFQLPLDAAGRIMESDKLTWSRAKAREILKATGTDIAKADRSIADMCQMLGIELPDAPPVTPDDGVVYDYDVNCGWQIEANRMATGALFKYEIKPKHASLAWKALRNIATNFALLARDNDEAATVGNMAKAIKQEFTRIEALQ